MKARKIPEISYARSGKRMKRSALARQIQDELPMIVKCESAAVLRRIRLPFNSARFAD